MDYQHAFLKARLTLAVAGAALFLTAQSATGGKPSSSLSDELELRDLVTDSIRSDDAGPYDADVEGGLITFSTGKKRKLVFDFSNCVGDCSNHDDPSGTAAKASMSLSTTGSCTFEFTSAGGRWLLESDGVSVEAIDTDSDGVIDLYAIEDDGSFSSTLSKVLSKGLAGAPRHEYHGTRSMTWAATVRVR